ncbi:glycosyl hydrolase family 18 protein [Schumannella sp. 10F1B-5-1]|uniref:glycosyl hydrolase family 18 protein n=1 Tax=Schumannella sp. 10F1B-5-1 TaxID=2590780 RepID=UPI001132398C|nr:glycosyl hydrolase family 18 protein [Schumannella sp. 10F1B-5-1]TPW76917.1 hypothetical protein FJ658_03035 [Schumannella sp. 10F1B-5-1]
MPIRRRRAARPTLIAAAATAVLLVLSGCGIAAPRFEMLAFQPDYANVDLIDKSADGIQLLGIQGVHLQEGGAGVDKPNEAVLAQRDRAKKLGIPAQLLVINARPGEGFSRGLAEQMLTSAANRKKVAEQLADDVDEYRWDGGIMLDIESIDGDLADDYAEFAEELREAVGPDVRLDAAIATASSKAGYRDRGFDVERLAKSLDHLTLMAYDLHGPWAPDDPGPVGDLVWQRKVLNALLKHVDPQQVQLGVAGYGYRWGGPVGAKAVSTTQARRFVEEAGAVATFDEKIGEWTATLPDGTVMWWSDARSLALRVKLAQQRDLHGVAVWSLAVSDPIEPVKDPED